ncbi:MAG: DUF2004 domain-containing protein [Thermoplasmataceae archaeon]|jgi:hypothetical protein
MEKGVEIAFQISSGNGDSVLVKAMADIVGNEFRNELDLQWRVFHVTLGEEKYFRILYAGPHVGKLHPHNEKKIRERFDNLSHQNYDQVMHEYQALKKQDNILTQQIQEIKEEYDLWEDRFWAYF